MLWLLKKQIFLADYILSVCNHGIHIKNEKGDTKMLTLIQKEIGNLPKMKLLSVWLILLGVMTVITSIIVLGLGTNNQLTEIIIQNQIAFNDHGNAWAGWPLATSLFGSLFTQVTFLFLKPT